MFSLAILTRSTESLKGCISRSSASFRSWISSRQYRADTISPLSFPSRSATASYSSPFFSRISCSKAARVLRISSFFWFSSRMASFNWYRSESSFLAACEPRWMPETRSDPCSSYERQSTLSGRPALSNAWLTSRSQALRYAKMASTEFQRSVLSSILPNLVLLGFFDTLTRFSAKASEGVRHTFWCPFQYWYSFSQPSDFAVLNSSAVKAFSSFPLLHRYSFCVFGIQFPRSSIGRTVKRMCACGFRKTMLPSSLTRFPCSFIGTPSASVTGGQWMLTSAIIPSLIKVFWT